MNLAFFATLPKSQPSSLWQLAAISPFCFSLITSLYLMPRNIFPLPCNRRFCSCSELSQTSSCFNIFLQFFNSILLLNKLQKWRLVIKTMQKEILTFLNMTKQHRTRKVYTCLWTSKFRRFREDVDFHLLHTPKVGARYVRQPELIRMSLIL